ncbi:uncharacterized protein LOC115417874 [Sphaeramia orbicularis]|uniref:uncharacterized protein LOC115417874 n=1 Tax=Sphaeramia orbicularis TaxID=375764 RepID=UPI0011804300|nr:uncharacterized protein LOC115417874 [Sphaeramia orbicularis]
MTRKGRRSEAQKRRWRKPDASEMPTPLPPMDAPSCSRSPRNKTVGSTLLAGPFWRVDEVRASFHARRGTGYRHRVLQWPTSPFTGCGHKLVIPPEVPGKKFVLIVGDSHLRALVDGFIGMPESQLSFGFLSIPGASASEIRTEVLHAAVPRAPDAVAVMAPSNNLTSTTVDVAGVDFANLLATCGNRWSKVFAVDFPPRLVVDAQHQDLLRQEYRRVAARMGVKYFSAVENFPLSNLVLWSKDGVHLSDREGMGILVQLLWSAAIEQLETPPPTPRVSPRPSPPVRKVTPKLVVRESFRAPPSPEPREWRTIGQGGKTSHPREPPQSRGSAQPRMAHQQEEESFLPLNPIYFSGTALSAMEKVSPSHLSCLADFKPSPKPKKVASSTVKCRSRQRDRTPPCPRSPVNEMAGTPPSSRSWRLEDDAPLDPASSAQAVAAPAAVRRPRTLDGHPPRFPTAVYNLVDSPPARLSCSLGETDTPVCSPIAKTAKVLTPLPDGPAWTITGAECDPPSPEKDKTRSKTQRVESIQASHCQDDDKYDVFSRNHQCSCNALTFLAFHAEGCHLTRTVLDRVLELGDSLYTKTKWKLIHEKTFQSNHLTVEEMPGEVFTDRCSYNVSKSDIFCGCVKASSPGGLQLGLPLVTQLECLTAEVSHALILVAPEVIAVFRDKSGRYGVFDSHSRDQRGLPSYHGKAIVMTFRELGDLADHLHTLFRDRGDSATYEFVPVSFHTDSPSDHPHQSAGTEVLDDMCETALPVLQTHSGTAVSGKIEDDLRSSSAVPQASVKLSKMSKDRRKKAMRRARWQQAPAVDKAVSHGLRWTKKSQKERMRYASCAEFRQKKIQAQKIHFVEDGHREQRLSSFRSYYAKFKMQIRERCVKRYHTDLAFQGRKKKYLVQRYHCDPSFRTQQKKYLVQRYRCDPSFRAQQKKYLVQRYRCDPSFRTQRQKYLVQRYRCDPSLRTQRQKYLVQRYRCDPSFRTQQKRYLVQRYKTDPEFRLHHIQRCSQLRRRKLATDAGFQLRMKWQRALSIKRKYRHLGTPHQPVLNSQMSAAIAAFRATVSHGPTYVCTVCHRTMFPNQVKRCKREKYSANVKVAEACLTGSYVHICDAECSLPCSFPPERLQEWICHNCDSHLSRGRISTHAVANNLELAPIPAELTKLNVLERQLIAKILPFAKIIALPKGQQRAVHGAVVCVPSEVENIVNSLPRPQSEAQLLQVKLKRHIRFKGYQHFYTVSMKNVLAALEKLREQHSEYADVTINEEATFETFLHEPDEDRDLQHDRADAAQWGEDSMLDEELLQASDAQRSRQPDRGDRQGEEPRPGVAPDTDAPSPDIVQKILSEDIVGETVFDDQDSQHDGSDAAEWGEDILDEVLLQVSDSYTDLDQGNLAADTIAEQQEELRPGLALDTCMQPPDISQEILSYGDGIFSVAPAQGNKPVGFFAIPKLEAMAFPIQFPTGENTLDEDRPVKLSPSRYFNARLFGADMRFAEDQSYLFFAQFVTETHIARGSMSIQMRKGKKLTKDGSVIKNSMLQDKEEVERLIQAKEATRFMQPLRGTPAYWHKSLKDLHAMLRQMGKPTFFLTFSAAEMRWPEVIQVIKAQQGQTLGDFSELDWKAKCDILRSNPVTVMRMFEKRVDSLMSELILSTAQPIGEVEDFFYRVEFQARGSPHIHMLVWVKNAPVYGEDIDEKVCKFIDRYISCQMPDPETDPELHKIVSEVQVHSRNHSSSCRKGNVSCRFGFPKLPMDVTWITEPCAVDLPSDGMEEGQDQEGQRKVWKAMIQRQQKEAKDKLQVIRRVLMDPNASFESLSDLLRHCDLEHEAYMKLAQNLTSGSVIQLKRHPKDCWVNAYNPDLLRAWNANMDIQYVLDEYCCAMYMMSYISKPEHEMTELLNNVIMTTRESDINQRDEMKTIMQAYAKHREVSAQEAVARTCSLPLKKCSRSVIFLSTDEEGLKMSLPMNRLMDLAPESEEVWMLGVPDKYLYRPQTREFEVMCLAEFASDYRVVYGQQAQRESAIPLLDDKGFITKRTMGKPAVIRFARFSETKVPEKHFRRLLKLYLPHRSDYELKDEGHPTYEQFYKRGRWRGNAVRRIVDHNMERYEGKGANMDKALQSAQSGAVLNAWNAFAPEVEVDRDECLNLREIIPEEHEEDAVPDYEVLDVGEPVPRIEAPRLSPDFVRKMFQSLNETQACIFYSVRQWCLRRVWGHDPEPFHYFVSGGAGCGKSHVIKCIHEEATRILRELPRFRDMADMSQPAVLLTAFTGTAAFNIAGKTLHSVLKLPRSLEPPYQGLGNALDEVRATLSSVEILVIDEISMVSKKLFAYVNWRFQQIKGNRKPFGGISVLAVGDFYQLPPLGRAKPLCVYEETEFDLWRDHFSMVNLTEIMRQKDDRAFAELLNRLRVKRKQETLSDHDRRLLMQAVTDGKDCPAETLHIFATNKQVDSHNAATVAAVLEDDVDIVAEDYRKDVTTGTKVPVHKVKGTKRDLPDSILAAQGARVMLIRNLNVEDGLVNGTFGTISNIVTERHEPRTVRLLGLQLDNPTAGQTLRKKLLGPSDNLAYIERSEESIGNKGGVVRRQFPIKLAFACTAHKVQGMTVTSAVVSLKRVFQPGMAYVALSRATSLQGLTVMDFDEKKIYADPAITAALEQMRSVSFQSTTPLLHHMKSTERTETTVTIVHHNTQGLPSHMVDLRVHHELRLADVLCLTETHLPGSPVSESFFLEGHNIFERSRRASYTACPDMAAKAGGGVAVYCKSTLTAESPRCTQHVTDLECLVTKIDAPVKVLIATVYRPPDFGLQKFLPNLNTLLDTLELMDHQPIIVCGDFNEDLLSKGKKSIRDALLSRGYTQLITESTTDKNTLIDHIYISQPAKCVQSGVLQTYYSYHSPIYCILTG